MRPFLLPDLGEGLYEAEVVEWHVSEGADVHADQPLVTLETDKAVTEVPSPWTGRLLRRCAAVGETIAVGTPLAEFDLAPLPGASAPPAPASQVSDSQPGTQSATNLPPVSDSQPGTQSATNLAPVASWVPGCERDTGEPGTRVASWVPGRERDTERPAAMPAVRELARELAVDLHGVTGTGPDGTIVTRDVAAAFRAGTGFETLTGTRRAMAEAMARSGAAVVPATVMDDARFAGGDVTARLVRAVAVAARAEPALNAWFDAATGRRLHAIVDVGLAVDAPHGLVVPVLRDAASLDLADIRAEVERLAALVRDRRAAAADLSGATITLSNFGVVGGRYATPVVTPPQVAILGAGRLRDGLLPLSLTYDHRAATGGEAARFLHAVIHDLERED